MTSGTLRAWKHLRAHAIRSLTLANTRPGRSGFSFAPSRDQFGRSIAENKPRDSGRKKQGRRGTGKSLRRARIKAKRDKRDKREYELEDAFWTQPKH